MGEWPLTRRTIGIVALVFLTVISVIGYLLVTKSRPVVSQSMPGIDYDTSLPVKETSETSVDHVVTHPLYVDIKGAVARPGMYQVVDQARVLDVVDLAGGFTEQAATDHVNFAQLVHDQMVIYIPKIGEEIPGDLLLTPGQSEMTEAAEGDSDKININLADSQELQQLTGIGSKKAEAIINYREEHGSFKTVEDLSNVSGFGEKTVEKLKDHITI